MKQLVIALCSLGAFVTVGAAQTVTQIGSEATFDVASWNIEQFQDVEPQMGNVVATMQGAGIDIWALQEITSAAVFDALLARLGDDWAGTLSTSDNLSTGFVYRKDMITVRSARAMFNLPAFSYEFAGRPPLVLKAGVTLPDSTFEVTMVTVHMKCCSDVTSWERRQSASVALKNRLDILHAPESLIVLGDFNDEISGSITFGRSSPYENFLSDGNYKFLLSDGVLGTWCGDDSNCRTGSNIDNIMISDELEAAEAAGSSGRYTQLLTELPNYVRSTSDHLPVFARLAFARPTGVEDQPGSTELAYWPIPARDVITIRAGQSTEVVIYDMLGRLALRVPLDARQPTRVEVGDLTPGLYVAKAGTSTFLLPVVR